MLGDLRVKMEQYYQDNRRYSTTTGGGTCGIPGGNTPTVVNARYFTFTCASRGQRRRRPAATRSPRPASRARAWTGIAFTAQPGERAHHHRRAAVMATKGYAANATCWVRKNRRNAECAAARSDGFSLIELMITLAVLGMLIMIGAAELRHLDAKHADPHRGRGACRPGCNSPAPRRSRATPPCASSSWTR